MGVHSAAIPPKRLVICCDGTWQSSVSGAKNVPSNVTRLARSIARTDTDAEGRLWQQVVYYDAGIGTGELTKEDKDRQGGFGIGFVQNVIEAYNFLSLNWARGDQVMCFGFSRGAYTARAVAGLVNDIGIISPRDMQDFPDLYSLYQRNEDSNGFRKSAGYREWVDGVLSKDQPASGPPRYAIRPHNPAPEASRVVQVVGVFDTVGSLGIPDLGWTKYNIKFLNSLLGIPNAGFHNVSLSPYIRHAFHALALDEHRKPFSPTLWHYPAESSLDVQRPEKSHEEIHAELKRVRSDPKATVKELSDAWAAVIDCEMYDELQGTDSELKQVWFPGVHINIGGGSDDVLKDWKGDFEQIALITFAWMSENIAPYLRLGTDLPSLARSTAEDRHNLLQPALDTLSGMVVKDYGSSDASWIMRTAARVMDAIGLKKAQRKTISDSVVSGWATGPVIDSFTGAMALAGSIIRTPGRYQQTQGLASIAPSSTSASSDSAKSKAKSLDENRDRRSAGPIPPEVGSTNETIHPSVFYRMKRLPDYKPAALDGFSRSLRSDGKGYEWVSKKGNAVIPEYTIHPSDSFTRFLAEKDISKADSVGAAAFLSNIDQTTIAQTS